MLCQHIGKSKKEDSEKRSILACTLTISGLHCGCFLLNAAKTFSSFWRQLNETRAIPRQLSACLQKCGETKSEKQDIYKRWTNLKMCKRIRAITWQLSVCLQKCGETTLRGNRSQLWPVARKATIVLRQLSVQRPPKNVRDVVSFLLSSSLSVNINYARITKIHSTPDWEK